MGLDMYLNEVVYLSNWEHSKESQPDQYEAGNQVLALAGIKPSEKVGAHGVTISVPVVYWRKSNQIHQWFVNNVQGGNDDCGTYYVAEEQLTELIRLCRQAIETARVANGSIVVGRTWNSEHPNGIDNIEPGAVITNPEDVVEILPTGAGFFFGSTDYDAYYLADLGETIDNLEHALANKVAESGFEYRSSW